MKFKVVLDGKLSVWLERGDVSRIDMKATKNERELVSGEVGSIVRDEIHAFSKTSRISGKKLRITIELDDAETDPLND